MKRLLFDKSYVKREVNLHSDNINSYYQQLSLFRAESEIELAIDIKSENLIYEIGVITALVIHLQFDSINRPELTSNFITQALQILRGEISDFNSLLWRY